MHIRLTSLAVCTLATTIGIANTEFASKVSENQGNAQWSDPMENIDFRGNDISSMKGVVFSDCRKHCSDISDCVGFSYKSENGGTCYFKNSTEPVYAFGVQSASIIKSSMKLPKAKTATDQKTDENKQQANNHKNKKKAAKKQKKANKKGAKVKNSMKASLHGSAGEKGPNSQHNNAPSSDGCCTLVQDIDYDGNDINNVTNVEAKDCCELCRKQMGCTFFSFSDFQGGTCWLKDAKGIEVIKRGIISGAINNSTANCRPAHKSFSHSEASDDADKSKEHSDYDDKSSSYHHSHDKSESDSDADSKSNSDSHSGSNNSIFSFSDSDGSSKSDAAE